MGFDDFLNSLMGAALPGGNGQPVIPQPRTASPAPVAVAPSAHQLPPEIVAALAGPFNPANPQMVMPSRQMPTQPPKRNKQGSDKENPPSYEIPEGETAGPELVPGVEGYVEPQYLLTSDMLPAELSSYQYKEDKSDRRFILMPDTQKWVPVPDEMYKQLIQDGFIDGQGKVLEAEPLPDLSDPSDEDKDKWREALPPEVLKDIKSDAERDVAMWESQLEELQSGDILEETDADLNRAQELETKIEEGKTEVSEYEALLYILYDVEPPESKRDWVMNNFVSPILGGLGTFFSMADIGRSQLGRRLGGWLAAQLSNPVTAMAVSAFALHNGFAQMLLQPILMAVNQTDQDVQQIYRDEGSIGVWEKVIAGVPEEHGFPMPLAFAWHAMTDTAYDPLTYLSLGSSALTSAGIRGGAKIGSPMINSIYKIAEPTLRYTDIATSLPGTILFRGGVRTARGVKSAINGTPYWKIGKTFAASRQGEGKVLRQELGKFGDKLEAAADEYDNLRLGIPPQGGPGNPGITPAPGPITPTPGTPGSGGISPAPLPPDPGISPAPVVGGLTEQALTGQPVPRTTTTEAGGPQVIGNPQAGPFGRKQGGPVLTNLEKSIKFLDEDENITPQKLAKKLKVTVGEAKELLPRAVIARDTMRGPVKIHPTKVPGLQPHMDNNRILDVGYKSFLAGEERGRKFIEEVNPILQKYELDSTYNSRQPRLEPDDPEYGQQTWTQKARAMSYVAEIATVYAKYFDNLSDSKAVNFLDTRPRGREFGETPGGYANEYTQALMEHYVLDDLRSDQLTGILRILTDTAGRTVEVESSSRRMQRRSSMNSRRHETRSRRPLLRPRKLPRSRRKPRKPQPISSENPTI
jgi:hypothetical protein